MNPPSSKSPRRISPSEPVTELRRVPIRDNGEPLVPIFERCPMLLEMAPMFAYRRAHYLREDVAARLDRASRRLPHGWRLSLLEGWRPPHIQRRMYLFVWHKFQERHPDWSDHQLKRVVNRFSAPLNDRVPPPHSTGAAMDVGLVDAHGMPIPLHLPYDRHDPHGFPTTAPGLLPASAEARRILVDVLGEEDITNYPSEFWHFSHGDQGWAYRAGHPAAKYGAVTPRGFVPPAEEVSESPLEFSGEDA